MRKTKKLNLAALLLVILLLASSVLGCTQGNPASQSSSQPASTAAPSSSQGSDPSEPVDLSMPIFSEKTELSYFCVINGAMSATMPDYSSVEAFKRLEEITNVHINWIHPASGSAGNEQFSLMIASNDLPDFINWRFDEAKGGSEALIRDNILRVLSDEELSLYMPNYMNIMAANPGMKMASLRDNGDMFQICNFNYNPATNEIVDFMIKGPYIRTDWVRDVGKEMPTTVDELYDVLTTIKAAQPNVIPFISNNRLEAVKAFAGFFGTRWGMHSRDGSVVYGPVTPEYKAYVETLSKWYAEGLLNSDFPVLDNSDAKILSGEAAFTIGSMGSGLTMQRAALLESDPSSDLDSLPYLRGPSGYASYVDDKNRNLRATAISASNEYPIESMRWLDHFYSEEGLLLATFGIEGESYNMTDGKPMLSELVMNQPHPQGYNQEEAIARYALGPINFPYARHIGFYEQVNLDTEQKINIQTNWRTGTDDILLPPILLSTEEATQYANSMADISTYMEEMTLKFIVGQVPMSEYDKFVSDIEGMGVEKAVAIQQAALDRFNAR